MKKYHNKLILIVKHKLKSKVKNYNLQKLKSLLFLKITNNNIKILIITILIVINLVKNQLFRVIKLIRALIINKFKIFHKISNQNNKKIY